MSFADVARRYAIQATVISVLVGITTAPMPLLAGGGIQERSMRQRGQSEPTPTEPALLIGATATPRLQIGPTPTPTPAGGVVGSTYTGPRHGWTIAWNDDWAVEEETSGNAGDQLVLTNGTTTLFLESRDGADDPDECLVALTRRHAESETAGNPAPAADPEGSPLASAEEDRAWAVYVVEGQAIYVECRALGETTLHIVARAPLEVFNAEAAGVLTLLDAIRAPGVPASSSPVVSPSATASPTPTASPTLTPTPRPTATPRPSPTPDEAEDVARAEATAIACLELSMNQTGCPVRAFEEAYRRHPTSARLREDLYLALVLNGLQHERLGSLDAARENYERAYDLIPSRPEAVAELDRVRPYADSLFADPFESTLGFKTTSDASSDSYYDNGTLGMRVKRAGYYFYYLLQGVDVGAGGYAVLYDARVTAGTYGSFDIYLGATSSMAYRFRFYPMSGNWVWERVDLIGGQATLLDNGFGASSNYYLGTSDRVEARVESGLATFLVNGVEVGASRLPGTGEVGFGVSMPDDSYEFHFAVAFDNLAVYRLGSSGGDIASLVTPLNKQRSALG